MDLSCLDDLVGFITDQDTRDADILYLNDLPTFSFSENAVKVGNIIKGDVTEGSPIVTNLTMNTTNLTAGEAIKSKSFPFCTNILSIDSDTQVTMDQDSNETCCEIPFYIKSSGQKFIDDQLELAKRTLTEDILGYFQGCIKLNEVIQNDILGKYEDYDSNTIQVAGNQYRGVQVRIDRYPYLEFYLEKIRLFFDSAITSNIRVYDLVENRHLDNIAFTSVASQITDIQVNTAYATNKQRVNLFFYYDASLTGYYQSWIAGQRGCGSCAHTPHGYSYFNGAEIAQGAITDSTLSKTGETYGMSLTYSLNCSVAPFVCSIRDRVQYPLLLLWASYVANAAARDPDKINAYLTLNRENHTELTEKYESDYNLRMFGGFNSDQTKKIKQGLMDRLHLPKDICFGRKHLIRTETVLP